MSGNKTQQKVNASPLSKPQTARVDQATCPERHRCHACGRGITRFGEVASSLAAFGARHTAVLSTDGGWGLGPGSGTLIEVSGNEGIVLCANHSITSGSAKGVRMGHYYPQDVAPKGSWEDLSGKSDAEKTWIPQDVPPHSYLNGTIASVIESCDEPDYALLHVRFDVPNVTSPPPLLQHDTKRPKVSSKLTDGVLLVGAPGKPSNQERASPIQASFGKVKHKKAKWMDGDSFGNWYTYATICSAFGMSGGGVYNSAGDLIGVYKGENTRNNTREWMGMACFLNLGHLAEAYEDGEPVAKRMPILGQMLTKKRSWFGDLDRVKKAQSILQNAGASASGTVGD